MGVLFALIVILAGIFPAIADEDQPTRGNKPVATKNVYWPGGKIQYEIKPEVSSAAKAEILKAMKDIEETTCIKFINGTKWPAHSNHVRFCTKTCDRREKLKTCEYSGHGINNFVNAEDFRAEPDCKGGNLLRTMMHLLGFPYEVQRADRDNYVAINRTAIKKSFQSKFNIKKIHPKDKKTCSPFEYDFNSVLHWHATYGSIDKRPTIKSKNSCKPVPSAMPSVLSPRDYRKIRTAYGCKP